MAINYINGKIYCIISPNLNTKYIGSTMNELNRRLASHRSKYNRYLRGQTDYTSAFRVLADRDCYIELIEAFPCNNKRELEQREGFHIRNYDCVNINIAGRSQAQRYQDNRPQILAHKKQFYQDNRIQLLEYKKQFYQDNKERLKIYKKQHYQKLKSERESLCLDILFKET